MAFPRQPLKLADCVEHGSGSGAELYVVEGDSAAGAVARLRNERYQAVLPMQGKPLNTVRASRERVQTNPWFAALIQAIGTGIGDAYDASAIRYDRVLLLMDPDADGIHCGALALMFFHRWMRPLIEAGRLGMALAPIATVVGGESTHHVRSESELQSVLAAHALPVSAARRYRGLAGTDLPVLAATCVDPMTRMLRRLGVADAEAAIAIFGH